jgi:hypothetical protein
MKILLSFLFACLMPAHHPDDKPEDTRRILSAWVETQNTGTDEAIRSFIDSYYSPALLDKMKNYEDHVSFYKQVISDFGAIQDIVYQTEEDTDNSLKVQLLKEATPLIPEPSPEEILVIEIDLDPANPAYLRRGLGMGALICYIKR